MSTSDYNKKFYSNVFSNPKSYYDVQRKKIEIVVKMMEGHKGGKILDIGCGDGFITNIIGNETKAEMHGIDVSKSAVEMAKRNGINAKCIDLDGKKLPYNDCSFDAVFCGDMLEHIFYPDKLLTEIKRILKKDGYVIVSVPNIASWYNRIFLLFGIVPSWVESSSTYTGNPFLKQSCGHIRAFTKRSLLGLLRHTGFRPHIVKGCLIMGNGDYSEGKERLWNKIDGALSRITSIASTIIVKAYK